MKIRGMGLLIGIVMKIDSKAFVDECFKEGLLLVCAGKDVVRFIPPLNVTIDEINTALNILEKVLLKFCWSYILEENMVIL